MVVLARRKNEAILINGVIRIEVVTVAKATVRVALQTPRALPSVRASKTGDGFHPDESSARIGVVSMDHCHMTLVNQQVVSLGGSISLGVLDADKTRALFFVDAPLGVSVTAVKPQGEERPGSSAQQNLLQFMGQPATRLDADEERTGRSPDPVISDPAPDEPAPRLLPLPARQPGRRGL